MDDATLQRAIDQVAAINYIVIFATASELHVVKFGWIDANDSISTPTKFQMTSPDMDLKAMADNLKNIPDAELERMAEMAASAQKKQKSATSSQSAISSSSSASSSASSSSSSSSSSASSTSPAQQANPMMNPDMMKGAAEMMKNMDPNMLAVRLLILSSRQKLSCYQI